VLPQKRPKLLVRALLQELRSFPDRGEQWREAHESILSAG
jgi:hypothetical protein